MVRRFKEHTPVIHPSAFLAEGCAVIGRVELCEDSSIWYGAVLRGDECSITIGRGSNIQDNASVHGYSPKNCDVVLGEYVTVGHNAVVHGCVVGDHTLIGMGATILNGARIGKRCIIAAGALVKENAEIPDDSLVVGVPGKVIRTLEPEQSRDNMRVALEYVALAKEHRESETV